MHLTPADLTSEHGTYVEETRGAVSAQQLTAWVRRRASHGGRVRVREVVVRAVMVGGSRDGCCATSSTTRDDVRAWLARHGIDAPVIDLRPIDLHSDQAVDTHDPPPLMHEHVVLRDAHCVFPGCHRDSRRCDLDHIEPYVPPDDGGPPGQTHPANLAPLCRRHHNAKTHHDWTYRRDRDGTYRWTSPTGHTYSVVPHSRAPLGH
ncbi:HNH endonuclease signature motif containing protein [Nocardioides marmoraquaticus]